MRRILNSNNIYENSLPISIDLTANWPIWSGSTVKPKTIFPVTTPFSGISINHVSASSSSRNISFQTQQRHTKPFTITVLCIINYHWPVSMCHSYFNFPILTTPTTSLLSPWRLTLNSFQVPPAIKTSPPLIKKDDITTKPQNDVTKSTQPVKKEEPPTTGLVVPHIVKSTPVLAPAPAPPDVVTPDVQLWLNTMSRSPHSERHSPSPSPSVSSENSQVSGTVVKTIAQHSPVSLFLLYSKDLLLNVIHGHSNACAEAHLCCDIIRNHKRTFIFCFIYLRPVSQYSWQSFLLRLLPHNLCSSQLCYQ